MNLTFCTKYIVDHTLVTFKPGLLNQQLIDDAGIGGVKVVNQKCRFGRGNFRFVNAFQAHMHLSTLFRNGQGKCDHKI